MNGMMQAWTILGTTTLVHNSSHYWQRAEAGGVESEDQGEDWRQELTFNISTGLLVAT